MTDINLNSSYISDPGRFKTLMENLQSDDLSFVEERLINKHGWLPTTASRARLDFLRFAALTSISERPLVPSTQVDAFWHSFLMFTRKYQEWCERHWGRGYFLHHNPGHQGAEGGWERTLSAIKDVFGASWGREGTGTDLASDCKPDPPQDPSSCWPCHSNGKANPDTTSASGS